MSRNTDSTLQAGMTAGVIYPIRMVKLTFKTGPQYLWTGVGSLVWDAQTFRGVGSLGAIGPIVEGVDVRADGTSISLSGIDPTLYSDSMNEIQLGAEVLVWFGLLTQGVILGTPYLQFRGQVDKPAVSPAPDAITISLALENRMTNLQRPTCRRYSQEDQNVYYPDDTAFVHVPDLADQSLVWGG